MKKLIAALKNIRDLSSGLTGAHGGWETIHEIARAALSASPASPASPRAEGDVWIRDANGIFDTETAQRLLAGELPEVTVTLEKHQQKTDYHGKLISISKPYAAEKREVK